MSYTPYHRKKDAVRFKGYNGSNTYIILGGTSPWPVEGTPPAVPTDAVTIPDAFCAAKATVRWVKEDVAGIYAAQVPGDTPGVLVTKTFSEILTSGAVMSETGKVYILLQATIDHDNISAVSFFRKIGFSSDLVPTAGHESDVFLSSGSVSNWGHLETLEYRKPIPVLSGSQSDFFQIMQY